MLFKILNSLSFRIFIIICLNYHSEYICKCKETDILFSEKGLDYWLFYFYDLPKSKYQGPSKK